MRKVNMRLTIAFAVNLAFGAPAAFADKLSDFKDADRYEEGCVTIPASYSERRVCEDERANVHDWCDGRRGPVTCGSEDETRKARRGVENAKKDIEELKEKKSRAESSRSNAQSDDEKRRFNDEVAQLERELYEAGRQLERAEKDLELRKKLVEDAIYTLDKCIAYRRAMMNIFASALDRVRNENETPELQSVARALRDKYEKQKSGHEYQISNRERAQSNCKDWRP